MKECCKGKQCIDDVYRIELDKENNGKKIRHITCIVCGEKTEREVKEEDKNV